MNELGQLALSERGLKFLKDSFVEQVAVTIENNYCVIFEIIPEQDKAVLTTGFGFDQEIIDGLAISLSNDSLLGYVLNNKQPVVITNLPHDPRFSTFGLFQNLAVTSSVSVVIPGKISPWGVLSVCAKHEYSYSDDDINFLQSVANILAEVFERQFADNNIRDNEAKFRGLMESAPDGMVIINENGIIEIVNKQFEKLTGYSGKDVIGQPIEILIPERYADHKHERQEYIDAPFARRMAETRELFIKTKGGTELPVEISLSPLVTKDGLIVTAAIRDITERKQAEARLKDSELKYHELYDNSPDMHLSVYPDTGEIWICNKTLSTALGLTKEKIIGSNVRDFYHEDCLVRMDELEKQFMLTGRLSNIYMQLKSRNGSAIDISLSASAVRDDKDNILYSSIIWRDVSEQKATEKALQQSEKKFQLAFNTIPDMLSIMRVSDGKIISINPAVRSVMGYQEEEVIGKTTAELGVWDNINDRNRFLSKLKNETEVTGYQTLLRKKNNDLIPVLLGGAFIELFGETCLVTITHNLSELKQAEYERSKLEKELFRSQKLDAIGQLTGGIAHDFNNILASILGYARLAMRRCEGLNEEKLKGVSSSDQTWW